jgi:hypothetical protein
MSLTGFFTVIIGDPVPPASEPAVQHYLTTAEGKAFRVSVDSAAADSMGDIRRFNGARVRVVARFKGTDSATVWVSRIDSVP